MKNKILLFTFFIIFLIPLNCFCSDFLVELLEQHYNEKLLVGTGEVQIYHTWQVKTKYGSKLLILTGKDYNYRTWLRNYLKKHSLFLVKLENTGDEDFTSHRAVLVNVQQVNPVSTKYWACTNCRDGDPIKAIAADEED